LGERKYNDVVTVKFLTPAPNHRSKKMTIMRRIKPYCDVIEENGNIVKIRRKKFDDKKNIGFAKILTHWKAIGYVKIIKGERK